MTIQKFPDHNTLSQHTAEYIAALITKKPNALLCLASGDTPIETYHRFVALAKAGKVDVSQCTFVGLDEWVGFGPDDFGSCSYYVFRDLFNPLQLRPDQIHVFDAKSADLPAECAKIDAVIRAHGGLDLLLVGMGMNGHIALNEPGTPFNLGCHVSQLAESTITVGQKYFDKETTLTQGITVGLRHLAEARDVILLVSGEKKASKLREALTGPITNEVPASIMQTHPNGRVWVDEAAGKLL
ncbi:MULTISPECIES: 6-phosphogluconolactonase [unclassified Spirosoma]|uniref:6-phosphogluconolactonase n=1 Tax=unclassified Spirosoma TaxID=2621999 RepID=UPI00095B97E4|nr:MULTISPECIES: glucosamine-6-phosphate deaminase [unclassified Spirosoma]MBN8826450.1 glucosamine-6-phosphate deaminase [Spirosoma sp.]OJW75839.1 MAG: glucosamine-6-phosphate deaminase [Spirosoma sp. 48-14]